MAIPRVKLNVGRQRVTRVVSSTEAGYIQSIRRQMATIEENLRNVVKALEDVTPGALKYGLQPIFEESQRLVPVDTGRLKRSGFLEVDKVKSGARASMGYARGGRPGYAVYVHEIPTYYHRTPTQYKFLEEAVDRKIGELRPRVIQYMLLATGIPKSKGF